MNKEFTKLIFLIRKYRPIIARIATEAGYKLNETSVQMIIMPLYQTYYSGKKRIYWSEIYATRAEGTLIDPSNHQETNKLKSFVNRFIAKSIKYDFLQKMIDINDKRKRYYIFTEKALSLFKKIDVKINETKSTIE